MMGSNKMILPHSSRLLILPPNINDTIKSEEKNREGKKGKKASHSHNQEAFCRRRARGPSLILRPRATRRPGRRRLAARACSSDASGAPGT